jgi:hypothetical protein
MRERWPAVFVASVLVLVAVVAGVGAVALGAEATQSWQYYLVMERAMAVATPVAVVLLGLAVLAGLGTVVTS